MRRCWKRSFPEVGVPYFTTPSRCDLIEEADEKKAKRVSTALNHLENRATFASCGPAARPSTQLDEDNEDDEEDKEDEAGGGRRKAEAEAEAEGRRRQEEATDIKSNNPHLAGGEIFQKICDFHFFLRFIYRHYYDIILKQFNKLFFYIYSFCLYKYINICFFNVLCIVMYVLYCNVK